jgi:hypothetical protein
LQHPHQCFQQFSAFSNKDCNLNNHIGENLMSDKRDLTTTNNNEVRLHDNGLKAGSLIDQSVRSLNQEQVQALGSKAAEEMIRLEVKQREINLEYVAGKKSAEDHIETWDMLKGGGKSTRQSVTSEIKTGAGNMRIESKSGATCFVATASYMDQSHPDVVFLRSFRDTFLVNYKLGVKFISWYWTYGPKLASFVSKHDLIRKISKSSLQVLVSILRKVF